MGKLVMGRNSYDAPIRRGDANNITIGNYTSIGEGCIMDSGFNHRTDFVSTFPFHTICPDVVTNIEDPKDIFIGSDCWLGEGVLVFAGKHISDGAVVGARSVVTKNIPPYEIWAGTPAKFIRKRFTEEQIDKLLKIRWFDWEDQKVLENAPLLMSNNIEEFISLHYTI